MLDLDRHKVFGGQSGYQNFSEQCLEADNVATSGLDAASEIRVERVFEDGKSECGMADYQVRKWSAWHHHMRPLNFSYNEQNVLEMTIFVKNCHRSFFSLTLSVCSHAV